MSPIEIADLAKRLRRAADFLELYCKIPDANAVREAISFIEEKEKERREEIAEIVWQSKLAVGYYKPV